MHLLSLRAALDLLLDQLTQLLHRLRWMQLAAEHDHLAAEQVDHQQLRVGLLTDQFVHQAGKFRAVLVNNQVWLNRFGEIGYIQGR